MILTYEGTDITGDVTAGRCVYEACEIGRAPWLSVEFDDDAGLWDRWSPQVGDRVSVADEGAASTGDMYVDRVEPYSGGYAVHATALPVVDVRSVREWRDTTLFAVAGQLAAVLGLSLAPHGCLDMPLARVRQDDEEAMAVLVRLAAVGGCTLDVCDGVLHLCGREWVEGQEPAGAISLGDGSDYSYSRRPLFASCTVSQPESAAIRGLTGQCGEGDPRLAVVLGETVALPGSSEVSRACSGMLAKANAERSVGYFRDSSLSPFSPGSVCSITCDGAPSLAGKAVVTRVRNDFAGQASKTWWRPI